MSLEKSNQAVIINEKLEEIALLGKAFEKFSEQTEELKKAYSRLDLELQKTNNYLNNILESLTSGLVAVDLDGLITTFNRAAENLTGYKAEDIIGKNYENILGQEFCPDCLSETIQQQFQRFAVAPQAIAVAPQAIIEKEALLKRKNQGALQVNISLSPLTDDTGQKYGAVMIFRDITLLKKLEEQAQRNSKLTAMGEMAADIAHEIRNPLGSIELFASLLARDLSDQKQKKNLADNIVHGVRSLNNVITNLLTFTRSLTPTFLDQITLHKFLDDTLVFSTHALAQNCIVLVKNYIPEEIKISGDLELLKQAFLNIILNAIQSMQEGGVLTISTKVDKDSGNVEVCFQDTGCGISKEHLVDIFNPFFTTKDHGTGLGLTIVHKVIEAHGGFVNISSQLNQGTIVSITLPQLPAILPLNYGKI